MTSLAVQGRAIIDELKSACCCPDCSKESPALHPCPPGSWYDESNPYRHPPKVLMQIGKVNRYFDNITDARTALAAFNAKRTQHVRA